MQFSTRCFKHRLPPAAPQIPSDKIAFNLAPDMKARGICEAGKAALRSGKYQMVRPAAHGAASPLCDEIVCYACSMMLSVPAADA